MSIKRLVSANYNFIKGQLGESIVERLFTTLNMHVCRYGYEITTPSVLLLRQQGQVSKSAIKRISNHPDFIIVKPSSTGDPDGQAIKVEVKYAYDGRLKFERVSGYEDDVYFLFLNNCHFYIASKSELDALQSEKNTASFSFKDLGLLEDCTLFEFSQDDKNTINAFKRYLEATFGNLSRHNQVIENVEKDFENVWEHITYAQSKEQFSELEEYFEDPELEFNTNIAKLAEERDQPKNTGQKWTASAEEELSNRFLELQDSGITLEEVAETLSKYFKRPVGGIISRLEKLELIPSQEKHAKDS